MKLKPDIFVWPALLIYISFIYPTQCFKPFCNLPENLKNVKLKFDIKIIKKSTDSQ